MPHFEPVLTVLCFLFPQRVRTKPKVKESNSSPGVWTAQEMEEKEEKIRHLEEVNTSLKQTNVDLNEEVAELKRQIGECQTKVREGRGRGSRGVRMRRGKGGTGEGGREEGKGGGREGVRETGEEGEGKQKRK